MVAEVQDWPGRWSHLQAILERSGPFAHPEFEASSEVRLILFISTFSFRGSNTFL